MPVYVQVLFFPVKVEMSPLVPCRPSTFILSVAIVLLPGRSQDGTSTPLRHSCCGDVSAGGVRKASRTLLLAEAAICEPIRLPMCVTMPYNVTRLPNLLFHSTQLNAGLILEQFQPLVDTGCGDFASNDDLGTAAVNGNGWAYLRGLEIRLQKLRPLF
jgi:hypothetical protein